MFSVANCSPQHRAGLVARGVLHEKRNEVSEFMRLSDSKRLRMPIHITFRAAWPNVLRWHGHSLIILKFSCSMNRSARSMLYRMRMQDKCCGCGESSHHDAARHPDIDEAIYMSDRILIMTPGRANRSRDRY